MAELGTALKSERIDYLDAARSVLMSLGVVLHSARIYVPNSPWLVAEPVTAPIFGLIVDSIHAFRMPAFFFISGFFCAMTLERYGASRFLRQRLPRIILPLMTVAVVINIPQVNWLVAEGQIPAPSLRSWVNGGAWTLHLWFLFNLALYFMIAAAVGSRALRAIRLGSDWLDRRGIAPEGVGGAAALVAGATALFLLIVPLALLGIMYERLFIFGPMFGLIRYSCTFLIGFAAMSDPRLASAWARFGWLVALPALALTWGAAYLPGPVGELAHHVALLMRDLAFTWLTLLFFRKVASTPSATWRYMSDASYSIYLLHHPIVIVLGVLLIGAPLAIGAKFGLICIASFTLSLAIHHFIVRRVPLVRLLLNGKPLRSTA